MKTLIRYILLLFFTSVYLFAGKWGTPLILGERTIMPYIGDVDYDSLGNIYIETSYCNWVRPISKDTIFPITELSDGQVSYKYKVFDTGKGLADAKTPFTEFSENAYITRYENEILFVRNDSIYKIDTLIKDLSKPILKRIEYMGNDIWILHIMEFKENSNIIYRGFYIFNSSDFSIELKEFKNTGGFPYLDFTCFTAYRDSYWYLTEYPRTVARFDDNGYDNYFVLDSIHALDPDFGEVTSAFQSGSKILLGGENQKIYSFDMDTKLIALEEELSKIPSIIGKEQSNIDKYPYCLYASTGNKYGYDFRAVAYKEHLGGVSVKYSIYYRKDKETEFTKIELSDTTYYVLTGLHLPACKDGKLWIGVNYYPDGDHSKSYYTGVICFDPFGETDVIEGLPSIITLGAAPNPASSYTKVQFYLRPSTKDKANFKIYNYTGELIKTLDNSFDYDPNEAIATKRINVEDLNTGIYYLVIDNGSEKRTIGFAVE